MISRATWSNFLQKDENGVVHALTHSMPPVVSLILAVLIGWQLARIVWMLVPAPAAGDTVELPESIPFAAAAPGNVNVAAIADSHIFGIADAEPVEAAPAPANDEDLEETRLVMTLKGTVASELPEFSVALIEAGGNEQKVFAIGDPVNAGAKLHAVYADRVVLDEDGVFTNLKLPREYKSVVPRSVRRSSGSTRQTAANPGRTQTVAAQSIAKLADVIRPTPYMQDGKPAGYRVYPGRDRKQFAALGLRPGDIIKDIDGQSLTDPAQAIQVLQTLGTAEQVTVTVERNGQAETMVLRTSQLELGGEQTQ